MQRVPERLRPQSSLLLYLLPRPDADNQPSILRDPGCKEIGRSQVQLEDTILMLTTSRRGNRSNARARTVVDVVSREKDSRLFIERYLVR